MPLPPALAAALGGGGSPAAGAGTLPGQPPFGSSPITAPTPNRGLQGQSLALVAGAKGMLEKALPDLGAESEVGQSVMKALQLIAKHVPEGTVPRGNVDAGMQQFMMARRQDNPMQGILSAMGGQGQGGQPASPPRPMPPM